jgi:hypothetical protein
LTRVSTLSRSPGGVRRAGEIQVPQVLALPELGRLRIAATVFVLREGPNTIGLLLTRDRSARTCLLTLNLRPTDDPKPWRATVERVMCEGGHSHDGVGASFLFYDRQQREIAE